MKSRYSKSPTSNVSCFPQSWNAFDTSDEQFPFGKEYQQSSEHVAEQNPSSFADGYLGIRVSEVYEVSYRCSMLCFSDI